MKSIFKNIFFIATIYAIFPSNVVQAQHLKSMKFEVDSVLITAIKTPTDVETVEINFENDGSLSQSNLVSDLLSKQSIVYIKNYGKGQLASISVRGFQASQTNMNWNGVKINSPMNGQSDLNLLQLGNNGVLTLTSSNSDNISGAVDLIQKTSFTNKNQLSFSASVGSYSYSSGNLSYLFSNKRWFTNTVVSYQAAKNNFGYKNPSLPPDVVSKQVNAETKLLNIDHLFAYRLNSRNEIRIFAKYFKADRNIAPSLFEANATENQKDQMALGKFVWHHQYLNLETEFNTAFVYQDLDYRFSKTSNVDKSRAYSLQTNFMLKNKFSDDLEYKVLISQEMESASSVNYTSFVTRHRLILDNEASYSTQNFTSTIGFTEMLIDGKLSPFLPKAGLLFKLYSLPANVSFAANYSAKIRYPSLNEMYWRPGGNENLIPENSHNMTLNIVLNKEYSKVRFKNRFEYFNVWAFNYIQWKPTQNGYWVPKNIGNVVSKGFTNNLDIDVLFKKDISLNFNLDYSYTKISKTKSLKQLIYAPYSQANFTTNFKSNWFSFGFNHHFTGMRFVDENNTTKLNAYYLLDFHAYKDLKLKNKDVITFGAHLNNMTNQTYFTIINRPLATFNFEFSLKYNLNFIKS